MSALRIVFIGAGEINFGSLTVKVPWCHAERIERAFADYGINLEVVGISDINVDRAKQVLEQRRSILPEIYQNTQVFGKYVEMLDAVKPNAAFVGLPPFVHGTVNSSSNAEIECANRGVHLFIEKPISCHPIDQVQGVVDVLSNSNVTSSVGYMFRYSKVVDKLREILGGTQNVRLVTLRYNSAYTAINKSMWWNMKTSGGPIVEQSTHFCDLARFIGGEVDIDSVQAFCIPPPKSDSDQVMGHLSAVPRDAVTDKNVEEGLAYENRIPRATTAIWKYKSGAVGSLCHASLLHGCDYECEIEVWGDGVRLIIENPYQADKCVLKVKRFEKTSSDMSGHNESEVNEEYRFPEDDPYETEIVGFLAAIQTAKQANKKECKPDIRSTFADAYNTYALSWKIRTQAEKSSY